MVLTAIDVALTAAVAMTISFVVTPLVRAQMAALGVIDRPNVRSSHTVPTPRSGGIAILAGFYVAVFLRGYGVIEDLRWLLVAMLVIAVIGFVDDVRGLDARLRLVVQVAAAALITVAAWSLSVPPWRIAAMAVTIFWIAGVTNAFNFMDGINGIASVEGAVAGLTLAFLAIRSGDLPGAVAGAAIAGACCGFLPWNFPAARIFMGDVASGALGFAIATLVVRYGARGGSALAAGLPLLPFLLDTSFTLLRRASRREKLFEAHRTHFYQRLVGTGCSHASVTMLWGALAIVSGAVGVMYERLSEEHQMISLAALLFMHALVALAIIYRERSRTAISRL